MKKITLLLCSFLTITLIHAQKKAITETGDEVILYDNGTWIYQNNDEIIRNEIPVNLKEYKKNENASFLLKSNKIDVGFWIDPKIWSFKKSTTNEYAEYQFNLKNGDLYAMAICEKIQVPLETIKNLAFENGKLVAPDLKIVDQEYRKINGINVLFLQMNGTLQGIKFTYYGYYFSNEKGSVQLITYTSQELFETYKVQCEELLNGIVELN